MRLKSFSLQSAEGILDEPSRLIETRVEAERLFSAAPVGNDRLRSTILQLRTQPSTFICLVAYQVFRCFAFVDEPLRRRAVMCFAAGQQDGEKTALSICECMDFRIAPSS
jgi:hypothetical protein